MNTTEILKLINSLEIAIFIKGIIALTVFLLIKNQIQRFVGFISFKSNGYVSLGRKVRINGLEGVIAAITISTIIIETEKEFYLIDTTRWKWQDWVFYKDC